MFRTVSARLYILWVCVSFYFVTVFLTGCEPLLAPTGHGSGVGRGGGAGGGGEIVLEIPVRHGRELMCVQGVGGSFSHSDDATRFDIDLDTSNSIDEEVYAPVTGVARVHTESASSGFGYHINIDLGNEVYAVVGHLSDVFISDGEEVAVGQMIGYEGCTGYCTGDHIHVGLHEGAASQTADHGVSIPALYRTSDSSHGGSVEHLDAEDFVCGIKSEGDPQDGHFYESALATNLWHPDGMLVKTPDNAKVYVIEGGKARWIASESVFWSHGYSFSDVVMISSDELACHGTGTNKDETGFVDALFDTEGQLWLLVGINSDPNHYRAPVRGEGWESVMASWGLDYGEGNWPETRGDSSGYFTGWPAVS